jgi:XTP/dITP diphosphohydrolase
VRALKRQRNQGLVHAIFAAIVSPMSRLIVATHNPHKTAEIQAILGNRFSSYLDLTCFPGIEPAVEDGETFEDNARIKALHAARFLPEDVVLADDSGLEVDALGGAPGVFSARYAGPGATDAANREKLLAAMETEPRRSARFRCVLALAQGGELLHIASGSVEGEILPTGQGEGGFGYDPLFRPQGHDASFGVLSPGTKNALSHRGQALRELVKLLDGKG